MNRIFIDLTALSRKLTGIENYTLNLTIALLNLNSDYEFHLLFRKYINDEFKQFQDNENVYFYISPFKSQLLTEQLFIPFFIKKRKYKQCFFPCFPPGLFIKKGMITIAYDGTMWKYPESLSLKNKLYFRPLTELGLKKASKIFTISDSSKYDIIKYFPKVKERIFNINAAIPDSFKKVPYCDSKDVLKEKGIDRKFLLCVSSLEPRKNIPFIIKSVAHFLKENDYQLVLAGREAWGNNGINDEIIKNNLEDRIVKTGYISNFELQCLYSNAEVFLYPSIYEGFGLPILEAFSCECPVITSNVSSMPDVAGDAALLIDPLNSSELVKSLESIISSRSLKETIIEKGKIQKNKFSWKNSAQLFLEYLENA